jgi:hypothetical protein
MSQERKSDAPPGARVLDFPSEEVSSPGRAVPAGTWNEPEEADAAQSTERPVRRTQRGDVAQVVEFPRAPVTQRRRRARAPGERGDEPSGRQSTQAFDPSVPPQLGDEDERPKFLASELLKTNWFPRTPLKRTARGISLGLGAIGAIAVLLAGRASEDSWLLSGVLAACAVAGAVPMPPRFRGVCLAALGVSGVGVAGWTLYASGMDPAAPLQIACITLCAAALFFRAAHRTSRFARALVAVGLAAVAGWLLLAGGVEAFIVDSFAWQSWMLPGLRLLLAAVVLSSLLSFLDPTGDGGGWYAAAALLGWILLDAGGAIALALFPLHGPATDIGAARMLATIAVPLVASIAAIGLAQVLAYASRPTKTRPEPTRQTIA